MKAIEESKGSKGRARLDVVLRRFVDWRRNRVGSKRIPEDLWRAAVDLTQEHPVSRVSRELRLDYYELKERVNGCKSKSKKRASPFVEFMMEAGSAKEAACAAVIEIEDGRGKRLKIVLPQTDVSDLLDWARGLWER